MKGVIDMGKWRLRDCPRCGGDLFIDRDIDVWYAICLQCSYRTELKTIFSYKEREAQRNKEPSKAFDMES